MNSRTHVVVDEMRPRERGIERGDQLRDELAESLELYLRLFASVGISEAAARADALRLADAIDRWDRRPLAEIEGIAIGGGLEFWQVMALNGRTEILSRAEVPTPGECSTLVHTPRVGAPFGIQTWDWHSELDAYWHTQEIAGPTHTYVGLTEAGILGKIGMNSAGLGLFFNILGHGDDAPTAVPVHILAAALLGGAGSVAEALDLLATAPIATSGALTLIDRDVAVCAEVSPLGVAELLPVNGFVAHSNHFLDARNAESEKRGVYEPDSQNRYALVAARTESYPAPEVADDLLAYLTSGPGEPALCCTADPAAAFGNRWATLATVLLEPAYRRARIFDGSPADAGSPRELVARLSVSA